MTRFAILLFGMLVPIVSSLRAELFISEFMADNVNGLEDEDDSRQDWIELFNNGPSAVDLDGWWLTDAATNPTKWRIPAVSIPAGGTLFLWASGKDRANPSRPLHTNFSLARSGEYLGLYQPDPTDGQPVLVHSYGSAFPAQAPDVSYGLEIPQSITTLVATGRASRYKVLANNSTGASQYAGSNYASGHIGTGLSGGWNVSPTFVDSSWTACTTGLGYDASTDLDPWIATNCQTALMGVNSSLCFRTTFQVTDPAAYATYRLRMKYEDGFVAWINGVEVGRANFSGTPAYNSTSTFSLDETIVNSWTEFIIPSSAIRAGNNVLAIQGLNTGPSSTDFLLLPEITAGIGLTPGSAVYFNPPSPNVINGTGSAGPVAYDATPTDPLIPRPLGNASSPAMKVTVKVVKTKSTVSSVRAIHRTMWGGESVVTLNDAGVSPDSIAADGVYSGILPTTAPAAGQMFRWRFEAQDSAGLITKLPAFKDAGDSPQYFGTVAVNSATSTSQLPVLEWFVEGSPTYGPTASSFRGSCYYLNRFYDNIGGQIHGQSTSSFTKKSYQIDSNDNFRFVWKEGERPVKDLNLLSNYADKTKFRNTLSHEVAKLAGNPHHFAFPVRVQLNSSFHGVMDLVEDGDDRMLERNGLDPDGALYKIYNYELVPGAEKKTRLTESNADLVEFTDALDLTLPLSDRRTFAYDELDIPATINYLVTRQINSDRDHGHKNLYLFRDTNRTREWRPIIWDVDLSYGRMWNATEGYFDDDLITNNPLNGHAAANRVYELIYESTEMRDMYVRRMRTLMDTIQQAPGTVNGILETRMRQIAAAVDPDPANPSAWTDGDLDAARWGIDSRFIYNRPREEVERVISSYLPQRRSFLYNTSSSRPRIYKEGLTPNSTNSTPIPTSAQTNTAGMVTFDSVDFLPTSGNQNHEYIILRNTISQAVDVSGWRLEGAVDHVFEGGTVITAGAATDEYRGLLHVVKDAYAFRQRTTSPKGGEKRLVQGNYQGQLSARGETIHLRDASGLLISSFTYSGTPTDLQQRLRISEIQYHPADPSPEESAALPGVSAGDFEYLELVNTGTSAINLGGAYFSQGLTFTFPAASLAAGGRVIIAKDQAAFELRYSGFQTTVFGPFEGDLANTGERIELTDAVGENILDFEYKDGWYPATDGGGRSLVLRDPAGTLPDSFGDPVKWAISGTPQGSPGVSDNTFAQAFHGWDNFHFTSLERADPLVSGPAADPDGDGRKNAEEYALGTNPRAADLPVVEFAWSMDGTIRRPALRFRRPAAALDVAYELLAGEDLQNMSVVATAAVSSAPVSGTLEEVVFRDAASDTAPMRFLRLRSTVSP